MANIPVPIKCILWGKSTGRCQYFGCNKKLYTDPLTNEEYNIAYHAHIIADSPEGPRGDTELSEEYCSDISNLMLLCDTHHRLIDTGRKAEHPIEKLREMKKFHEDTMEILTSLFDNPQSHIIHYAANIHNRIYKFESKESAKALLPEYFPASHEPINLSLEGSHSYDNEAEFWKFETANLEKAFRVKILNVFESHSVKRTSLFAIAPQPLLIKLGTLFSDLRDVEVYQLHREPKTWKWIDENQSSKDFKYSVFEGDINKTNVALNLSLSADIENSRIFDVLGSDTSIWKLSIDEPYNDFLKFKSQLSLFREELRKLLNKMKKVHGEDSVINVFLAVPVSIAIEIGRVWMPKADLPMKIWDENKSCGGFIETITISSKEDN